MILPASLSDLRCLHPAIETVEAHVQQLRFDPRKESGERIPLRDIHVRHSTGAITSQPRHDFFAKQCLVRCVQMLIALQVIAIVVTHQT